MRYDFAGRKIQYNSLYEIYKVVSNFEVFTSQSLHEQQGMLHSTSCITFGGRAIANAIPNRMGLDVVQGVAPAKWICLSVVERIGIDTDSMNFTVLQS